MNVADKIKLMCAPRGLKVRKVLATEITEDDHIKSLDVSFIINDTHEVGFCLTDNMDEFYDKVGDLLSKYKPMVTITDEDYIRLAEKAIENDMTTSDEIEKGDVKFYFEIVRRPTMSIDVIAYDSEDNELDHDFCQNIFYEFVDKINNQKYNTKRRYGN